jgi:hypothetical protein
MSMKTRSFQSSKEAMKFLEALALGGREFIFRGQPKSTDKLSTTLHRLAGIHSDEQVKDLLRRFEIALANIGVVPFQKASRLDWLEYARHYGVPLPVIDFTYSPYVALFFAFNLMEAKATHDMNSFVCVLALNTLALSKGWAKATRRAWTSNDYYRFKTADDTLFEAGFTANVLQLIPFPGKKNRRMMRQIGLLLYDTLDYPSLGFTDIESFIESIEEEDAIPTLYKVYIHKQCAHSIFERLELMNITGSQLFLDERGAAMDVINSYFYNSRVYFRDLDNQ